MPSATAAEDESQTELKQQRVWAALKKQIIRERQRKKEEHEAEVEGERLRKEQEAREKQDVMTLGETREQIQHVEEKLSQLKEEKHQLFLQLKKVLNEDDNRKKQQNKDDVVLSMINGMPSSSNMVQSQLFLPPVSQTVAPVGRPPLVHHIITKPQQPPVVNMKRVRSPSPPYALPTAYMHHKQQYQPAPHKIDDGRCRDVMSRAVLWNKPSQYNAGSAGATFYALPQGEPQRAPQLLYGPPMYHPHHLPHHAQNKQFQVVMSMAEGGYGAPPPPGAPPPTSAPPSSSLPPQLRHSPQHIMHTKGQLQHLQQHTSSPKQVGITSGYPVRQQTPSIQNPNMYPSRHRY